MKVGDMPCRIWVSVGATLLGCGGMVKSSCSFKLVVTLCDSEDSSGVLSLGLSRTLDMVRYGLNTSPEGRDSWEQRGYPSHTPRSLKF